MPGGAQFLTVMRRVRDVCLRPLTRFRPGPAPASHPRSGPHRAGPVQPRRGGPGEYITMPVICGRVLRIAVREGNPAWQPLLLCNGFGASLELLQPFVDALDPRRAVIRFDMPGLGGSPAPVVPYHLAAGAPLLSGVLDQLGSQQADVPGISWGGGLAQQFALRCPARVRRLVLVATAPGALMVPGFPRILLRMLGPRRHHPPPVMRPGSPVSCSAAAPGRIPRPPATCCTR
jgi:pimeloyl-ACP methyl ester carboxylesterase